MEQQVSLLTLIVSVATSFIASLLFFWYQKGREKRIKSKIAELNFEEEYLEKIKKGNVELIRSCFKQMFLIRLFLVFSSVSLFLISYFSTDSKLFQVIAGYIMMGAFGGAAGGCFYQFKTLLDLSDVPAAKARINFKKDKLISKL